MVAYVPTGPDALMPRVYENPIDKTVKELTDLDPFVDMVSMFYFKLLSSPTVLFQSHGLFVLVLMLVPLYRRSVSSAL